MSARVLARLALSADLEEVLPAGESQVYCGDLREFMRAVRGLPAELSEIAGSRILVSNCCPEGHRGPACVWIAPLSRCSRFAACVFFSARGEVPLGFIVAATGTYLPPSICGPDSVTISAGTARNWAEGQLRTISENRERSELARQLRARGETSRPEAHYVGTCRARDEEDALRSLRDLIAA